MSVLGSQVFGQASMESCDSPKLFRAPILLGGGSVINRAYPVYFLALGRDGVTINALMQCIFIQHASGEN